MNLINSRARSVMRASSATVPPTRSSRAKKAGAALAVTADFDVVQDRHAIKERHVLKSAPEADGCNGVARLGQD